MSDKGNKTKKAKPDIEDSPEDIPLIQDDTSVSASGSPCICKTKREISCPLHGG